MKFDLHCHSYYSDGKHAPEFVAERAGNNGITHLALTDHDCIEGHLHLAKHQKTPGVNLIMGVEISTLWEHQEIHVVGLCFDSGNAALTRLLKQQQDKRRERIEHFARKLGDAGLPGLGEYVESLPCVAPGRSHVADFLIKERKAKSRQKAFKTLGKNGRFYTKASWCSLEDAIVALQSAGGVTVLAHPHRYPLGKAKLGRLLNDFSAAGGTGLEICYSNIGSDITENLGSLGTDLGLWVSVGSDFHSADASWMDLGRFPPLPVEYQERAIWQHPDWAS